MFFKPGKVIATGTRMINNMIKFMEISVINPFVSSCSSVKYVICSILLVQSKTWLQTV